MTAHPPRPERNRPKDHWTLADIFDRENSRGRPLASFTHRNYEIGMHTHDFVEINLVLQAAGWHYFRAGVFPIQVGDLFIVPPGVEHGYRREGPLDVQHLLLHPRFLAEYGLRLRTLPGFQPLFSVEPHFREETEFQNVLRLDEEQRRQAADLLLLVERQAAVGGESAWLAAESGALTAIALFCQWRAARPLDAKPHALTQALQAAFDLVEARFAEHLELADLAAAACLQHTHFCRVFKTATGLTPREYIVQRRVREAKRRLSQTDQSLTLIALETGFYDSAHFCRAFSRLVGVSPKTFRQRMQKA